MKNSWKQKQKEGSCQEHCNVEEGFESKYHNLSSLHFVQYGSLVSMRDMLLGTVHTPSSDSMIKELAIFFIYKW